VASVPELQKRTSSIEGTRRRSSSASSTSCLLTAANPVPRAAWAPSAATIAAGTTAPYDQSMHERLREAVDTWLAVPEASLRRAIPHLAVTGKVVTEGAGALPYAALDLLPEGPETVAVISGGNVTPDLLASLLDEAY